MAGALAGDGTSRPKRRTGKVDDEVTKQPASETEPSEPVNPSRFVSVRRGDLG